MRDTDRDLRSLVVVRSDSPYKDPADLKGETIAAGAVDSPQATLIPCSHLRRGPGSYEWERAWLNAFIALGEHCVHILAAYGVQR